MTIDIEAILATTGVVIICAGASWIMWTVGNNDKATTKITRSREEINNLLARHDHNLYEITFGRDCAPCDVEFTLIKGASRGLPSRVMLRYLKDLKSGCIGIKPIRDACIKAQAKHEERVREASTL